MTTISKYAPTFDHWNLWDTCKFKIENAIRHAYWGTLMHEEQHFRMVYQQSIIHKINGYFKLDGNYLEMVQFPGVKSNGVDLG